MMKSVVGDPIFWPGLVYSPININGLIFALGTVSGEVGLLFEEFSEDGSSAVCRRKTGEGWEKITAGLSVKSSEYEYSQKPDLLICWIDDGEIGDSGLPVLELSGIKGKINSHNPPAKNAGGLKNIFPEDPAEDLLHRGETVSNFEETVRQLDQRIKKLKNEQ
jgi:hypothetical protein